MLAYNNRGNYGKKKKPGNASTENLTEGEVFRRIKLPEEGQVLGVVLAMIGGSRMKVSCKDGKERMCRIPGKLRNKIWVKEDDVVIVKPYEIEGDTKGDIIWRYNPLQAKVLRERGEANF